MSDYVIVGAGSAGCVMAARLSEDPDVTVTLIEAGGPDRHPLIHVPAGFARMTKGIASWGWSTVPQRHLNGRVLRYTQARVLGGGSSINAQIYTRGHAADYDGWARKGCEGWSYREVLPYFKRAEDNRRFDDDYHARGGPLGVSDPAAPLPICEAWFEAAQALGIPFNPDFNGARQEGVGYYQLTQRNARRSSAATAYLAPIRRRRNLTVRTGVRVLRIAVERGRATGVEIAAGGSVETVRAEREVIVSGGAVGSPKLLLHSGIGPAEHLKDMQIPVVHDLPGVGSNLHDHLNLFTIWECTGDHTYDAYAKPHRALWAGLRYLLFRDGPAASSLFETGGFWYAGPEGERTRGERSRSGPEARRSGREAWDAGGESGRSGQEARHVGGENGFSGREARDTDGEGGFSGRGARDSDGEGGFSGRETGHAGREGGLHGRQAGDAGWGTMRPDVQFHLGLGSGIEAGVVKLERAGVTLNSAYLRPESRGTVRLASPDPADAPLIDPDYWAEPHDRAMAFEGLRLAREIMRQDALKPFAAREALPGPAVESDAALFDYACASAKTDHHPVGTSRMGTDEMAVVGPDLKVHGIEALRVADSSVMPRLPSCNTNAPTIMIGEKASDLILGREPLPPAVIEGNER